MSDPVTNVEIEDVLSSIRRLVAEGEKLRDSSTPAQSPPQAEPRDPPGVLELGDEHRADIADKAPEGPVRFVLTSAYRVDPGAQDGGDPAAAARADDDDPDSADIQSTGVARQDEDDTAGEAGTSTEESSAASPTGEIVWTEDDPEPHVADNGQAAVEVEQVPEQVPEWVARGQAELDALEAGGTDPASETEAAVQPREPAPGETRTETAPRGTLESTIAELEAAVADKSDDWEPDGSEETPVMNWETAGETGLFFSSRFTSGGPVEEAQVATEDDMDADEVAEKFDAAEAMYSDDDIEDPEDPLQEQLTAYLEQDDVLDEETLRQMVAEIVRQELQGPLGERITRNVRKLVRREIYRALAEHGFE